MKGLLILDDKGFQGPNTSITRFSEPSERRVFRILDL